jgi:hypothetical protein
MPRLQIDGIESGWDLTGLTNVSGLMGRLYERAAAEGRVVCRVEVDGQEIDPSEEGAMAGTALDGITEVRVVTGTAAELYRSGLEGALTLADAIASDIARATASFRRGDFGEGLSMYMACVESMETFFQLSGAILGGIEAGAFVPPPADGEGAEGPPSSGTSEALGRLLEAQRAEDWTLMADLLEYEVVPDLEGWKRFLERLKGAQPK